MRGVSLQEDLERKQEGQGSSDRAFGIVFYVLVGLSPLRADHPVRWWAVILSGAFLIIVIIQLAWLAPLNRVWTKLGVLMGRIISPVITALLFYVVVTPTALLFRLLGKDPLRLHSDPGAGSYWMERHPPGPPPGTMPNQF